MEPVVFETKDPTNISIQLRHQEGDPPPSVDGFSKPLLLIVGGYPLVNQQWTSPFPVGTSINRSFHIATVMAQLTVINGIIRILQLKLYIIDPFNGKHP